MSHHAGVKQLWLWLMSLTSGEMMGCTSNCSHLSPWDGRVRWAHALITTCFSSSWEKHSDLHSPCPRTHTHTHTRSDRRAGARELSGSAVLPSESSLYLACTHSSSVPLFKPLITWKRCGPNIMFICFWSHFQSHQITVGCSQQDLFSLSSHIKHSLQTIGLY